MGVPYGSTYQTFCQILNVNAVGGKFHVQQKDTYTVSGSGRSSQASSVPKGKEESWGCFGSRCAGTRRSQSLVLILGEIAALTALTG